MIGIKMMGSGTMTVATTGGQTIDGYSTVALSASPLLASGILLGSNGANWDQVAAFPASQATGSNNVAQGTAPVWLKVTKTFTDFSTAGTTNTINILNALPAGSVVHAVKVWNTTTFSGGGIATYQLSVGVSANHSKYLPTKSLFTQPTTPFIAFNTTADQTESQTATAQLTATATTTGANLNAATQGSVDIYVLVSVST
jgi:hypothetical protein